MLKRLTDFIGHHLRAVFQDVSKIVDENVV